MKSKIKNFLIKKNKRKLICLTSYSTSVSKVLDKYCDLILIGDSLANVLYGMKTTHNLKLETMINHAKAVALGAKKSLLVVDMPKDSYKNPKQALYNAKNILKETKCDAVKIENNNYNLNIIKTLVKSKINVMGHIGYTPQFKKKFKVEGKNKNEQKTDKSCKKNRASRSFFNSFRMCIENDSKKNYKIIKNSNNRDRLIEFLRWSNISY